MSNKINEKLKINEKINKIQQIKFHISNIKIEFVILLILDFLIQCYNSNNILLKGSGECYINIDKINDISVIPTNKCQKNTNNIHCAFGTANSIDLTLTFSSSFISAKNMFKDCTDLTYIKLSSFATSDLKDMSGMFENCNSLKTIEFESFGTSNVENMSHLFYNCSSLNSINLNTFSFGNVKNMSHMFDLCKNLEEIKFPNSPDTSNLENMEYMFSNCINLPSVDISKFDTAKVTNMNSLFKNCQSLESININGLDISHLINMGSMFQSCKSLKSLNLSSFVTTSVKFMNDLFHDCIYLESIDFSNFKTNNVIKMESMFENCESLTKIDLNHFYTPSLRHMASIFSGCKIARNIYISNFDTFQVTNFANIFYNCHSLEEIKINEGHFVTNMARDMSYMFFNCSELKSINLLKFNTERVLKMNSMFQGCSKLSSVTNINFKNYEVLDMNHMFDGCSGLTELNLLKFFTNSVENMNSLFYRCSNLKILNLTKFNTQNVLNMHSLFYGCSSLTSIIISSLFNTAKVVDMGYMFYDCSSLTEIDSSNFDTKNVETFDSMFYNCRSLKSLSVSSFETPKANSMNSMFHGCSFIETINLNKFDTKKVLYMEGIFYGCKSLIELNISNFNVIKVNSLSHMFYECSSLTSINLPNLRFLHAVSTTYMFAGCSSLTSLNLTKFDGYCVEDMDYMFSGCSYLTNLIVDRWDTRNVRTMNYMFSGCISLTSLNITTFQTNNLQSIKGMFYGCESLEYIDLSRLNTYQVTTMEYMFYKAKSLKSISVNDSETESSYFKTDNLENMRYMFAYCTNLEYIDLSFLYTPELTDMSFMFLECKSLIYANLSKFTTTKVKTIKKIFFGCSKLEYINLNNSDNLNIIKTEDDILKGTLPNMVFCINNDDLNNKNKLETIIDEKNNCPAFDCDSPYYSKEINKRKTIIMKNEYEYDKPPNCINTKNCTEQINKFYFDYGCYHECPNITEPDYEDPFTCLLKGLKPPKCTIQQVIIGIIGRKNCTSLTDLFQVEYNETEQGRIQLITDLWKEFFIDKKGDISKHVLDNGIVNKTFFNEIYEVTTLSDKNLYDNLTYINIQDCENLLRLNNSITDPKEELMLLKIEYSTDFKIPIIEYVIFNQNMTVLDTSVCNHMKFIYSIPIKTQDINIINESSIYKYNPDSEYNNEICFQFTTQYNTDITLYDRRKEFNDYDYSLCESNCKFLSFENNRVQCECPVKTERDFNKFLYNKDKMNSIFRFHDNKEQSNNLAILKCFKMLFSKLGFSDNYPSIIYIVILVTNIAAALFFCISDYKNLYSQIQSYTENLDKIKGKRKDKSGRHNILTTGNNNPPPKSKGGKIYEKQKKDLISEDSDKNSDNTGKFDSKIMAPTSLIDSKNMMKGETDRGLKTLNKEDYYSERTEMEINMLSYIEAQKSDKRGFVDFYFSFLKTRQLLIYIFTNDYNSFIVKSCFICFAFGISVGINTFFYNDSVIQLYYEKKGDVTLSESVAKHLGSIFISIILASILKSIMFILTLTDTDVIDIKDTTHMSREEKTNRALVKVTTKSTLFFIINFIIMGFFWIYAGSFGIVFKNTQIYLLMDGVVTFCGVLTLPLLFCLLPAALRMVALNGKNNECLYKFSQFLELI